MSDQSRHSGDADNKPDSSPEPSQKGPVSPARGFSGGKHRRPFGKPRDGRPGRPPTRVYQLVVNRLAGGERELPIRLARRLERRLRRSGWHSEMHIANTWDDFVQKATMAARQRPFSVVVFGGDGSVRLAASLVSRVKGLLGIVPCGRHNNIFHSLYGHTDFDQAMNIVRSEFQMRIDAGLANSNFFVGSLVSGMVPAMLERLGDKKLPRLTMAWGKLAARAADDTMPQSVTIKVDASTFRAQPLILHVHLLPDLMTLRFAPGAAPDDGRIIVLYDREGTRDVAAHYIRDLKKQKYQYTNGVQMIRGGKVTISPAAGRVWLIDGDRIEFSGEDIGIEVLHRVLRVFSDAPKEE